MSSSAALELVQRLGLASEAQVRALAGRVHRRARELPALDAVWIDALLHARVLTSYQAAELSAGRGAGLAVGPYLLLSREVWPLYAAGYRAVHRSTREEVQLILIERLEWNRLGEQDWRRSVERQTDWESSGVATLRETGQDGDRRYVITRPLDGRTAAQWVVAGGRFAPAAVEEIARQMAESLAGIERHGACHGDVSSHSLVLTPSGQAVLPAPGLRGAVRPAEGYAQLDLPPEAYEFFAPERASQAGPATAASDIYSCACVWWHLLTGRTPVAGGSSLAKLRAAEAAVVADVRDWAPATPERLAGVMRACLSKAPGGRPESLARLAAALGPSTVEGRKALQHALRGQTTGIMAMRCDNRPVDKRRNLGAGLALGAALLVVAAALFTFVGNRPRARQTAPVLGAQKAPVPVVRREAHENGPVPSIQRVTNPVRTATYFEPIAENAVLLDGTVAPTQLTLRRGQHVCAPPGKRVAVQVPPRGWRIAVEALCFENLDFVGGPSDMASVESGALVRLEAGRATFRSCTFRSAEAGGPLPVAIAWRESPRDEPSGLELPSGRIDLVDCWFYGVDAAIDIQANGARAVSLENTLHSLGGPLVRSAHCPAADEPLTLALVRVTLREAGPLWQCDYRAIAARPGEVSVRAVQCVFTPAEKTPLLLFRGADSPAAIWACFRWTGEGSLMGSRTPTSGWIGPAGDTTSLDDSAVPMAGLVRGAMEFAGTASDDPQSSRAVQWQAPLRTAEPPGIEPDRLPAPRTKEETESAKEH